MHFHGVNIGAVPIEAFAKNHVSLARSLNTAPNTDLDITPFSEITPTLDANDFVEGLLGNGGLSILYGESNCGKSFFATDLAIHVALGRSWQEREVDQGAVLYHAAEGGYGARNRIAAFAQEHGVKGNQPFYLSTQPIDLLHDPAATHAIKNTSNHIAQNCSLPIRLIVIDTLSRVLAGGNENSPDDMGAIVQAADNIRAATGAHLMFIHHSGKEATRGPRGHSLLRAAADTEIRISRDSDDQISVAKITKQRDFETSGQYAFELKTIELSTNRRGQPVTSCVIRWSDRTPRSQRSKLAPLEIRALDELKTAVTLSGKAYMPEAGMPQVIAVDISDWKQRLQLAGYFAEAKPEAARKRWERARISLESKGQIRVWNERVWLTGAL